MPATILAKNEKDVWDAVDAAFAQMDEDIDRLTSFSDNDFKLMKLTSE